MCFLSFLRFTCLSFRTNSVGSFEMVLQFYGLHTVWTEGRVSPCGICGGHSSSEICFLRFLLSTLFHRNSPYSHVLWGIGNRPVGISLVVINNNCFTATNALNVDSELPTMQVNYRCKFYSLYDLSCAEAMINIKNIK
jgi:hypothetical protein